MKRRNKNHEIIKYKRSFDETPRYSMNVDTSLSYLVSNGVLPREVGSYNESLDEDYNYVGLTEISERQQFHKKNIKDVSEKLDNITYFDDDLEQDYEEVKIVKKKKNK